MAEKKPDAAPPKEVDDDECLDTMQLEAQCTLPHGHPGDHDYETPREIIPASPPSDAAPVAWRYKYKGQTEVGWFFTGLLPQDITEEKWDIEPLYVHPEDATTNEREVVGSSEDTPEGNPGEVTHAPLCKYPTIAEIGCKLCIACGRAVIRGNQYSRHVEDAPGGPKIVCLCGSTRFYGAFQRANYEETMQGRVVLSVGFYPHSQTQAHGEEIGCTEEQKRTLDDLHLRKIDLADEILVLNVGGYVGESTAREIVYAEEHGKLVRFLEVDRPKGDET